MSMWVTAEFHSWGIEVCIVLLICPALASDYCDSLS